MTEQKSNRPDIVRLTHWATTIHVPPRAKKGELSARGYTVYGIDEEGEEHIYAEFDGEEAFHEWMDSDPLAVEARRRMFESLLKEPTTREAVIKINLKSALDAGDDETALELFRALSPDEQQRLLGKGENATDDQS